MGMGVGDLVWREPLKGQVVALALADRYSAKSGRTGGHQVLWRGPEHPEIVQDLREVANLVVRHGAHQTKTAARRQAWRSVTRLSSGTDSAPADAGSSTRNRCTGKADPRTRDTAGRPRADGAALSHRCSGIGFAAGSLACAAQCRGAGYIRLRTRGLIEVRSKVQDRLASRTSLARLLARGPPRLDTSCSIAPRG